MDGRWIDEKMINGWMDGRWIDGSQRIDIWMTDMKMNRHKKETNQWHILYIII